MSGARPLAPESESSRGAGFILWFEAWGSAIWSFIHFGSMSHDEYREEFLDLLSATRGKVSSLYNSSGHAASEDGVAATRVVLKEWFRRQRKRRSVPSAPRSEADSWESLFLLYAVFNRKWSLEKVARLLGLKGSSVRFRVFSAL